MNVLCMCNTQIRQKEKKKINIRNKKVHKLKIV